MLKWTSLLNRLRKRGYSKKCLAKACNRAVGISRSDLLFKPKHTKSDTDITRFITRYSVQHKEVRGILNSHWYLLQADARIKEHITESPQITFRKVKSIKDQLIQSPYTDDCNKILENRSGTFKCQKCDICPYICGNSKMRLPNGKWHSLKCAVDCATMGVIYLFVNVVISM